MRKSERRLHAAAQAVLVPGELLGTTGIGWAAQCRPKVPLLFLARRQHWFALTDRRVLVFARRHGGPTAEDLVLGKRFSFFTLEKVHRHRPLFQIRMRGANDSRLVLEFRPGQRALASELASRLTRALPAPSSETTPAGGAPTLASTDVSASTPAGASAAPPSPQRDADADTAAAFWGER